MKFIVDWLVSAFNQQGGDIKTVIAAKPNAALTLIAAAFLAGVVITWLFQRRRIAINTATVENYRAQLECRTPEEVRRQIQDLQAQIRGLTPRRIAAQARDAALRHLRPPPAGQRLNIVIQWMGGTGDIEPLAQQLQAFFRDAGWTASSHRIHDVPFAPGVELHIRQPEDPIDRNLREAVQLMQLPGVRIHRHPETVVPHLRIGMHEDTG